MIQHTEQRAERVQQYAQEAAWQRGKARAAVDLADHIAGYDPGHDPGRQLVGETVIALHAQADRCRARAERYDGRIAVLLELIGAPDGRP